MVLWKVDSAIQSEQRSTNALERSIGKLLDSLTTLSNQ